MRAVVTAALLALAPLAAAAAGTAPLPAGAAEVAPAPAEAAAGVALDDLMWQARPVIVFADSPEDPLYVRQMQLLAADPAALAERDVRVIADTDPAAQSEIRRRLRPRGFSLVIMDKDLRTVLRKPLPWDVREITAAIDRFPLRRQEMLEQHPAGR